MKGLRIPSESAKLDDAERCLVTVHDDLADVLRRFLNADTAGAILAVQAMRSRIRGHLDMD